MLADENRREVSAEHTLSAEETHSAEETQVDYLGKARELADSYTLLVRRKAELEREIEESRSWFYTRDDAIYKLSMGAHEESERVQTSSISNTVERTVLNCDKVLASMNREIQNQRMELLIQPYRDVCAKIELFEIALRSLRGMTRLVAEQLSQTAIPTREALPPAARSWKPRVSAYPTTSKSTPTLIRSGGASVRRGNVRERRD